MDCMGAVLLDIVNFCVTIEEKNKVCIESNVYE
jgi:hypothetical protein